MKKTVIMYKMLLVIILLSSARMVSAQTIYMPPFTYTGRVMNYLRISYTSEVQIYARNTNGVLLAQTKVFKSLSSVLNYALYVPLANTRMEKTAMVGDSLIFEVDDGAVLWVNQAIMPQMPVGNPGTVVMADIILQYDTNNNGIADAYEAMIETLRFELDGIFEPYDPEADYDGDGMSNRNEYLAGSDPLNAADVFRIAAVSVLTPTIEVEPSRVVIRFYAMRGRTYSVVATAQTQQPVWENLAFTLSAASDAPVMTQYLSPGAVEAEGMVTIYAEISDPAMLYRLRVE